MVKKSEATPREKPLHWVGSSKKDYLDFPEDVQTDMGYALGVAQLVLRFIKTFTNQVIWKSNFFH